MMTVALALVLVLVLAVVAGLGVEGAMAAPPLLLQVGDPIAATQSLAGANPFAEGPPPVAVLLGGALLLLGLALSTRGGA